MIKKSIKLLFQFILIVLLFIIIISGLFYNDKSRQFIFDAITGYFSRNGVIIKVEGVNISNIDKIDLKIPSNTRLIFKNCSLSRSSLYINEFLFESSNQDTSSNIQFKDYLSFGKILRIFIKNLSVKKGILNINGQVHTLNDFQFHINENSDNFYILIDKNLSVNIEFYRNISRYEKGIVKFENVFGYKGQLEIYEPEADIASYKLLAGNDEINIISDGFFKSFLKEININDIFINYKNQIGFNLYGKIFLCDLRSDLSTKIYLDKYFSQGKIPDKIWKNLQSLLAEVNIISDWRNNHKIFINFEKNGVKVGDATGKLINHAINLQANIPWMNIYNYQIKALSIETQDLQNYFCFLHGDNFSIKTNLNVKRDILVKDFIFTAENDFIRSENPFIFDGEINNCRFSFHFDNLEFFRNLYPIKGKAFGHLFFEKGNLYINLDSPHLHLNKINLFGVKMNGGMQDSKISLKHVRYNELFLSDCIINKKLNKIFIDTKLNDVTKVNLNGVIDNNEVKLQGQAVNKKNVMIIQKCLVNLFDKIYKLKLNIKNQKQQGEALIDIDRNKFDLDFFDFSLKVFSAFFNRVVPQCKLKGSIRLSSRDKIFIGDGKFHVNGFVSKNNNVELNISNRLNGLYLDGNLRNGNELISIKSLFPIVVKNDGTFAELHDIPLNLSLVGKVNLSNIFDLSDGYGFRGYINTNFNIKGTLEKPILNGFFDYSDALIQVGSLILKNGKIELKGKDNILYVKDAEFIDSFNKKAKASGNGRLFFCGIFPNIDTNLDLDFNNFRLFDSDTLKINITGKGTMKGALDNMKLEGNVNVPYCELSYLDMTNNNNEYDDIIIENDPFLIEDDNTNNKDFFKYDIKMNCPKIDIIGNIYNLELCGDLILSNYQEQATLSGILQLRKGKLDLFSRRMVFSKGEIKFLREYPFNPIINLKCTKNINNILAILEIHNDPKRGANINLYSRPHYTKDIILSQMMFGKSTQSLSIGETAQLAHAVSSLGQRGYIFSLLNTLQGSGLVDNISFSTEDKSTLLNKNTQSSNNHVNVKIGKYLNDNIFISANKKEESTSFDVDISLDKNTSLKVNTLGEIGINWKYRY